jgi:hypothetical protein
VNKVKLEDLNFLFQIQCSVCSLMNGLACISPISSGLEYGDTCKIVKRANFRCKGCNHEISLVIDITASSVPIGKGSE